MKLKKAHRRIISMAVFLTVVSISVSGCINPGVTKKIETFDPLTWNPTWGEALDYIRSISKSPGNVTPDGIVLNKEGEPRFFPWNRVLLQRATVTGNASGVIQQGITIGVNPYRNTNFIAGRAHKTLFEWNAGYFSVYYVGKTKCVGQWDVDRAHAAFVALGVLPFDEETWLREH